MKSCTQCQQTNPDDALFCHKCGTRFTEEPTSTQMDEDDLWRTFIGSSKTITFSLKHGWSVQSADRYYMDQFRKFKASPSPRFTLTWNWPAFLVDPFLWFLYRKMYLYAAVYLVGPVVFFFLTGDITVGFVWRLIAGVSANYLYFWHVKEHLKRVREEIGSQRPISADVLRDAGGVQPYVFALAILLHLFVIFAILKGPPQDGAGEQGGGAPQGEDGVF